MRVAIAGKGGSGKTTISATLARLAARRGHGVVAIDADSNPNLASALGFAEGGPTIDLPHDAVSRRPDGPRLTLPLEHVLDAHSRPGPDGVRLATMGEPSHAGAGCLCSAHAVVSALLADLGERPSMLTVIDLEGTPEHLSRGTARHADLLLLVAEPYFRSLEAVRRLATLAAELDVPRIAVVANKLRRDGDAEAIAELSARLDLSVIGGVPFSLEVLDADAVHQPLLDVAPSSDVVVAIGALLDEVLAEAPAPA
ncbi:MAG: ArsA-related P-loop ATPase [Acidimicrobiales bacterium]